jgi:hypothetical protein
MEETKSDRIPSIQGKGRVAIVVTRGDPEMRVCTASIQDMDREITIDLDPAPEYLAEEYCTKELLHWRGTRRMLWENSRNRECDDIWYHRCEKDLEDLGVWETSKGEHRLDNFSPVYMFVGVR